MRLHSNQWLANSQSFPFKVIKVVVLFKNKHWVQLIRSEFGLKSSLCLIMAILSLAIAIYNHFTHQYSSTFFFGPQNYLGLPGSFILYIFSLMCRDSHPRLAYFLESCWALFAIAAVTNVFVRVIQYTPFQSIDTYLNEFDLLLHFNLSALMNWAYSIPILPYIMRAAYQGLAIEIFAVPLFLALVSDKRRLEVFFVTNILTAVIGYSIYFFFPSTSPASVISNPHFTPEMINNVLRFYAIQAHQKFTIAAGGIIGFPSFHVIWAILSTYVFFNRKKIFYPLAIFNAVVIFSTMGLGWHYLADVIGGAVICILCIIIAEKLYLYFSS